MLSPRARIHAHARAILPALSDLSCVAPVTVRATLLGLLLACACDRPAPASPATPPSPAEPLPRPASDRDPDAALAVADPCPGESETPNGFQDGDGCPDDLPPQLAEALAPYAIPLHEAGLAQTGKVSPALQIVLRRLAAAMREFPEVRVEVRVHCDPDTCFNDYGLSGSARRARAVVKFLVGAEGIAPDRIQARGWGPEVPLDTNKTPEGRARNRRIEFLLVR